MAYFPPNPNGQTTAASSAPFVLPVAQETAIRNVITSASSVVPISSAASAIGLPSNTSRKSYFIENNGPGILYILKGSGVASPINKTLTILPGGSYEPVFVETQAITYIYGSAGSGTIQELT